MRAVAALPRRDLLVSLSRHCSSSRASVDEGPPAHVALLVQRYSHRRIHARTHKMISRVLFSHVSRLHLSVREREHDTHACCPAVIIPPFPALHLSRRTSSLPPPPVLLRSSHVSSLDRIFRTRARRLSSDQQTMKGRGRRTMDRTKSRCDEGGREKIRRARYSTTDRVAM